MRSKRNQRSFGGTNQECCLADVCSLFGRTGVAAGSGTTDEFKGAEFSSSIVDPAAQDIGFSTGTRTFTITYGSTEAAHLQGHKSSMFGFFFFFCPVVQELEILIL